LSTEITIPEKIQTMLCELILDLQNVSFVNDIRSRLDHPDVKVLISELNDHLSFPKYVYSTISFSEERILFAILTNQLNDLNKKDSMKMKISSSFRQNGDPKQFQSVSPKKSKIQKDIDACSAKSAPKKNQTDLSNSFYYPDFKTDDTPYKFNLHTEMGFLGILRHFIDFREAVLGNQKGQKMIQKIIESIRHNSERHLWEVQLNEMTKAKERNSHENCIKNRSKMLDELTKRQEMKKMRVGFTV
jgi:hypothetical protein